MSDPRHLLGITAEEAVACWLKRAGWTIRARRERRPGGGEIDVVAVDPAGTLVAIEVRARRTSRTGAAVATVDAHRVARIGRTLVAHARVSGRAWSGLRVDLVTVEPLPDAPRRWRLRRLPGLATA